LAYSGLAVLGRQPAAVRHESSAQATRLSLQILNDSATAKKAWWDGQSDPSPTADPRKHRHFGIAAKMKMA
jgi:hypothetical protein